MSRPLSTGGSCIDWLITNSKFVMCSGISNDLLCDHLPVFAIRKKTRNKHVKTRVRIRSYKHFHKDNFNALLLNKNWAEFYNITDPDELWEIMQTNIFDILSVMCPIKIKSIFADKPEWLTDELLGLMKQRNLYVKLSREKGAVLYYQLSRFLRNKCNKMVNSAKGDFIKPKLEESKKHPKNFWRQINSLITVKKNNDVYHQLNDPETDDLCVSGTECDVINLHYANIGSNILKDHVSDRAWDYGTHRLENDNGIEFDEIVLWEVEHEISKVDVGKSSGIEFVNSKTLKIAFTSLSVQLTHIFNCSIRASKFPTFWAHGSITPIPKDGDLKLVGNWRPISLVPLPGKIMEHLVHRRLLESIQDANVLAKHQYGFVPGRSTAQAVFRLYTDLSGAVNNGDISSVLFVDFSKAFDSIHHGRLLNKLSMLGLSKVTVDWFGSYLTRTQTTFFNNKTSNKLPVSSGVPQGSVLGPLLFTLYINDICDIVSKCSMLLYADDCVLYTSHRKLEVVEQVLQSDTNKLSEWCNDNLLKVNVKKTKCMLVSTRQKLSRLRALRISINNAGIGQVVSYNYLGVIFDTELGLCQQITETHNRVRRKLFQLRKIRKFINEFAALQIYKQTILPILDYCGFLTMSGNKNDYFDLQVLQNDAIRAGIGYPDGYTLSRIALHEKAKLSSLF